MVSILGIIIVLVQIVVLILVGYLYVARFRARIDNEARARIKVPGMLMNGGLLSIDSVSDKETMENLVGEDLLTFEDSMMIGINGNVIYALDTDQLGKYVFRCAGVRP